MVGITRSKVICGKFNRQPPQHYLNIISTNWHFGLQAGGRPTWMGYVSDGAWEKLPVRSVTFSVAVKSAPSCFSCFFPIAAIARTPFHVWPRQRLCRRRQVRSKPLWPNRWSGLASSENAQAFTYNSIIARTFGASLKQMPKGMVTPSDLLRFHIGVPSHQCRQRYRNTLRMAPKKWANVGLTNRDLRSMSVQFPVAGCRKGNCTRAIFKTPKVISRKLTGTATWSWISCARSHSNKDCRNSTGYPKFCTKCSGSIAVERVSRKLYKRLSPSSSLDSIRMLAEERFEALSRSNMAKWNFRSFCSRLLCLSSHFFWDANSCVKRHGRSSLQQIASEPAMPLRVAIHSSNGDSHFARSRWEGIHVAETSLTAPRARRASTMSQRSAVRSSSQVHHPVVVANLFGSQVHPAKCALWPSKAKTIE